MDKASKTPAQWRKEWVTALRSGQYHQTQKKLRDNNGFCCLGVACDIYDNSQWNELSGKDYYSYSKMGWIGALTAEIMEAFEVNDEQVQRLYELNDFEKWSFNQIADFIEGGMKDE